MKNEKMPDIYIYMYINFCLDTVLVQDFKIEVVPHRISWSHLPLSFRLRWGCEEFGQTLGRGTKMGTIESITWYGNLAGHAYALTCMPQVYARNNWLRRFRLAPAVESTTDQQMLRTYIYPPTQFVEYVAAWQKQQQHGLRGGVRWGSNPIKSVFKLLLQFVFCFVWIQVPAFGRGLYK